MSSDVDLTASTAAASLTGTSTTITTTTTTASSSSTSLTATTSTPTVTNNSGTNKTVGKQHVTKNSAGGSSSTTTTTGGGGGGGTVNKDPHHHHHNSNRKTNRHDTSPTNNAVNNNSSSSMVKMPKNCPWTIGQRVEACDIVGNWYPAKILDIKDFKLLIHFQRWSSRYDQWFDMDSDLIRVKEESKKHDSQVVFNINEEVLARWSDSKLYPARIIKIFSDNIFCHVLFYDGYKKKVKLCNVQKLPTNYEGERFPPKPQSKEFNVIDPINHNDFVCDICKKGFRKESLLSQHRKHYHNIVEDNVDQLSSSVTKEDSKSDLTVDHHNSSKVKPSSSKNLPIKNESISSDECMPTSVDSMSSNSLNVSSVDTTGIANTTNPNSTIESVKSKRKSKSERKISDSAHSANDSMSSSKKLKVIDVSNESTPVQSNVTRVTNLDWVKSSNKKVKPNLTLPFFDAKALAEEHENDNIDEIVKCICPIKEENGLMVQCELCLSWQHGLCMGFKLESDVPVDGYFCPFCRSPQKPWRSQRNSYQLNHWLKNAFEPVFALSNFTPINVITTVPNPPLDPNQVHPTESKLLTPKVEPVDIKIESSFNRNSHLLMPNHANAMFDDGSFYRNTGNNEQSAAGANACFNPLLETKFDGAGNASVSPSLQKATPKRHQESKSSSNTFDLPPSSGLFSSSLLVGDDEETSTSLVTSVDVDDQADKDKKSFILHDFTHSADANEHGTDLNMDDEDHINNLIDISLKSDFFSQNKLLDDDEAFANQVKATNMLSSAIFDIMNNLHSLNYKIHNHRDVAYLQIVEKQKLLKQHLELIESKVEKIEKDIELKDSYAIHTSSSTLTATSPENFGISDMNSGGSGTFPATVGGSLGGTNNASLNKTSSSSFSTNLFDGNHCSNDTPLLTTATGLGSSLAVSSAVTTNFNDTPTLSSLHVSSLGSTGPGLQSAGGVGSTMFSQMKPSQLSCSATNTTLANYYNIPPKLLTSSNSGGVESGTTISNGSISPSKAEQQTLARLYISTTNLNNSNDEQELLENQRPSMTHEYLPVNMNDAEIKLELSYHFKDLSMARDIVLSLK